MKLNQFLLLLCLPLCLFSCQKKTAKKNLPKETSSVLPPSTGNLSELVVVISDELWEGEVGAILKSVFQENIPAIPQQEAFFDVYAIAPKDFSSIFKTHKNVLRVSIGNTTSVERKGQEWSKNQLYISATGRTPEQLKNLLHSEAGSIRASFLNKNRKRRLEKLKPTAEKKIQQQLDEVYGINITIPKGYQVAAAEDHFFWLRRDHPKVNIISNLWIYSEDYSSSQQFAKQHLIYLRDSLGRAHVEGARDQSYMATEMIYDPDHKVIKEDPYTIETRGLWTMVNDFLGGPYVAYAFLDEENQKIIYAEGFLYCPGERKRSHILELEALLSSIKLSPSLYDPAKNK
jgi:hypothetical protein